MSKRQNKTNKLSAAPQQVKIIAGSWRGTKIPVLLKEDIRPTPVRVRETLFNWLQAYLQGSYCLDLFAGSGALGFEAISRGAQHVTLVDNDPAVTELLATQIEKLESKQIDLIHEDGLTFLSKVENQFDIIFLDPPFSKFNLEDVLQNLANNKILKPNGLIYAESASENFPQKLPGGWHWQRQSKAGQVEYGLISTAS